MGGNDGLLSRAWEKVGASMSVLSAAANVCARSCLEDGIEMLGGRIHTLIATPGHI